MRNKKQKNRVAYIIPGMGESTKSDVYQDIGKVFKRKGITPILVPIKWKGTVLTGQIKQFNDQYKKSDEVYVFGFSIGAMIAFITAPHIKPKKLILVSLSPWFKEDVRSSMAFFRKKLPKKIFERVLNSKSWKKDLIDRKNYSFNLIVKKISAKTILIAGEKEMDTISSARIYAAHKKIKNSKLIITKGAEHNIKQILPTVKKVISRL